MRLLKFFLLLSVLFYSSYIGAEELSISQQEELVSSLNYLQFSTAQIKMSENKAVAEDVYYSIINELRIEAISNRDLNFEYGEFLAKCANLKLTQNEKEFIKQLNDKEQKNAYLSAFSNFGSVFNPGQSPQQMVVSLVYASVASAVAIANTKNQLKTQLEKDMFYLNQDIMRDIYEMQTTLFTTSAKLLSESGSEGRINENSMNIFMNAIKLVSAEERKNALCEPQLQINMAQFPPYWFELGNACQELNELDEALKAYDKFIELKQNDIVVKDKNYVTLIKNKIQILLGSNPDKVTSNALLHKQEIIDLLEILKINYLDSEAGEKNAYLAKIYYLIGCVDQSMFCLDYIINSKSTHPDYIEEAVSLKLLIMAASDTNNAALYQNAYNLSQIRFGNSNIDFSKLPVKKNWWERMWDSIVNFFAKIFSASDLIETNDYEEIDTDYLCFHVPNNFVENYDITLSIDDILYTPIFFKNESDNYTIGFVKYEYDDIDDNGCIISMCAKSKSNLQDVVVKFKFLPIKAKIIKAAEKAYMRVGSDIISHNAQSAVEFGETILGYDYEVEDEEDLRDDIRDDMEDEGKENNWTKEEINSAITKELTTRLAPDMKYLQERMSAVEKSHYLRNDVMYSPSLVKYFDDYYLVGIVSIYDSKINKEYSITSDGDIKYDNISEKKSKTKNISDLTKSAIGGDINSMVSLGIAYIEGYNTHKKPSEGLRWLFAAVNSNDKIKNKSKMSIALAYKYIGECYWKGIGVIKDKNQAKKYFRLSKQYGFDIEEEYL